MNVLTGSKHCWNQHLTTITLFSRQFEENWVEILRLFVNAESQLQSDVKS